MKQQAEQIFQLEKEKSTINSVKRMLKIILPVALVCIVTGTFTGCKKDTDKKQTCRISTAELSLNGAEFNFLYDNDGKLQSITSGATAITYAYAGNTTIVTSLDSGRFFSKKIISQNAAGLALNVRTEFNPAGTEWSNNVYEYSGEELMRSTGTSSGGSPVVFTYTWSNHNMISATSDSDTTTLAYYTDKPGQTGDYLSFAQLIQGYEVFRCKNLVKSIDNEKYIYEFKPDGNISFITVNAGFTYLISYQYKCN